MRLKQQRVARNMTQRELANALNVSRTTVTMWETGRSEPDIKLLKKIANILNVSVDELLQNDNDICDFCDAETIIKNNMFAEKLKQLRVHENWTQSILAKRLNLEKSTIAKYESSKAMPSIDVLIKICALFGVTADYLIGVVEQRKISHKNVLNGDSLLSDKEVEIIETYRALNKQGREYICQSLQLAKQSYSELKKDQPTKSFEADIVHIPVASRSGENTNITMRSEEYEAMEQETLKDLEKLDNSKIP